MRASGLARSGYREDISVRIRNPMLEECRFEVRECVANCCMSRTG